MAHVGGIARQGRSACPGGPAVFVGGWALQQLWLFWLAPVVGAALAGFTYKAVLEAESAEAPPVTGRVEIAGP